MSLEKIYVIGTSHIDPIWMWNRSSGRCSWLNTMHSVVRMMRLHPDLKFSASSSAMYRWIEETDPALFDEIRRLVAEKRWELVGGWEVQSDVIIARECTLRKQAEFGKAYFQEKFGVDVRTAFCVDSFGHSGGLPKILSETGFDRYVFMRGNSEIKNGLFHWHSTDGKATVTGLHIPSYGTNPLYTAKNLKCQLENLRKQGAPRAVLFFGIGDHGGGIYEGQYQLIKEAQREWPLEFSTLESFFADTAADEKEEYTGEIGPVFRGCYSTCHGVKQRIAAATERLLKADRFAPGETGELWKELLFVHFHDSLSGTSVRSVYEDDIYAGLGMVRHGADNLIDRALARKAAAVDTSFMPEGGVQVWNPHDTPYTAVVQYDSFTDPNNLGSEFNCLRDRENHCWPLQQLPPPTGFGPCSTGWAKLTSVVELAPGEVKYLAYGRMEASPVKNLDFEQQRKFLEHAAFRIYTDHSHTWGFDLLVLNGLQGEAELTGIRELVNGASASILRAEYRYRNSEIRVDLIRFTGIEELELKIRLDWHEPECVLKLELEHGFTHPVFRRGGCGVNEEHPLFPNGRTEWHNYRQVPQYPYSGERAFLDWCDAIDGDANRNCGFFCADLHGADHYRNRLRLTLLRSVLFTDHAPFEANPDDGYQDFGYSFLDFWFFDGSAQSAEERRKQAIRRLAPAEVREVTGHAPSGK